MSAKKDEKKHTQYLNSLFKERNFNNQQLISSLFKNKQVKEFCLHHALSEETILKNFVPLSQYKEVSDICNQCDGTKCYSPVSDMTCTISINEMEKIQVEYSDCPKVLQAHPGNLEVIDFSVKDIDIEITNARITLFKYFDKFCDDYFKNIPTKGIYLWGKCGVGKSLLLFMFAKSLVSKGAKVLFAYYPDLVRQFQTSFGTSNVEELIYRLKTADILMLDDIARESNTPYVRDEILGPILQYRCDNGLPMFMTSNRDFKLLEEHISETNTTIDKIKGRAILERIKYLMKDYELVDKDYRNN